MASTVVSASKRRAAGISALRVAAVGLVWVGCLLGGVGGRCAARESSDAEPPPGRALAEAFDSPSPSPHFPQPVVHTVSDDDGSDAGQSPGADELGDFLGEDGVGPGVDDGAGPPEGSDSRNYYVQPRSYGTRRDTEPPRYVRALSDSDLRFFQDADWLLFNADYRMRYEARENDFRLPHQESDFPFMLRTRAFVGVREKFDPLRFGFEFEDARRDHSDVPPNTRDDNYNELIQAYAELYFEDVVEIDRPFRVQYGRMAFEYLDRRLIARNDWRNTTNTFQGFRTMLGKEEHDWQLDFLALQPLRRIISRPDHPERGTWFYGAVGDWRRWSKVVTLQPYWLVLDRDALENDQDKLIYTIALRGYGIVGKTGYDFDFDVASQIGKHAGKRVSAFGLTTEIGYTWEEHEMTPRFSVFFGYGSGDQDPFDDIDQRFDRLYGFSRPWSASDYFIWENVVAVKPRLEFEPSKKCQIDMGYSAYWLASDRDAWVNAELWDPFGLSGDFCGQELDIRVRRAVSKHLDLAVGFAYFIPGDFPINLGKNKPSSFVYVELAPRLIK